jgi:hypothetical protein
MTARTYNSQEILNMRTRDLRQSIERAIIDTYCNSERRAELVSLCARLELAELALRRVRREGHLMLGKSWNKYVNKVQQEREAEQTARLEALLRNAGEPPNPSAPAQTGV